MTKYVNKSSSEHDSEIGAIIACDFWGSKGREFLTQSISRKTIKSQPPLQELAGGKKLRPIVLRGFWSLANNWPTNPKMRKDIRRFPCILGLKTD
jgi:hypothetical protein